MGTKAMKDSVKKKRFLKIIPFFIILVIIFAAVFSFLPAPKHIKNMLLNNKNDFVSIANIYYEDFKKHDDPFLAYSLCYKDNGKNLIRCHANGHEHEIILSDREYLAFQNIINKFQLDKHSLEFIYVYDSFVVFGIINKRESLIYSANDKRPLYVNSPDENPKWFNIRKVTDNWYYAFQS